MRRLTIASLLLVACGSSTGPRAGVAERQVRPSEADPTIRRFDAPHFVWLDTARAGAPTRLLVLLAGTGGAPGNATLVGRMAAEAGYAVIGLEYPNDLAVVDACSADPDPDCMGRMRAEIVDGVDRSPHVAVDERDAIAGRLASLLRLLAARYPNEGWSAFLLGAAPRWSAIAVGGLSQGGGHAAYIGVTREVPRVLMFGAPADGYGGQPARWTVPGATPGERWFALAHVRDPFTSIPANWHQLGLDAFGAEVRVEDASPPYGGSHLLRTDLLPATGSYAAAHASVYGDGSTPRSSGGAPRLAAAWRYMLGDGRPAAGR